MTKEWKPINQKSDDSTFRYSNETFSGCDMTATMTVNMTKYDEVTQKWVNKPHTKVLGEMQTISYSIHMEKKPVRSIGNVNAKDYVMGPRTIAGSLVFSVFNKHFAEDVMGALNERYSNGMSFLVDELPPFDITISAANEYGYRSRLVLYGIRLLNEGQVMSVNDVYTENTYQFFATDMEYLSAEMFYTRDEDSGLYKLRDKDIKTYPKIDNLLKGAVDLDWDGEEAYNKLMNRPIKLYRTVKQPLRPNSNGIVEFSIDPYQEEGTIYITNSNNDKFVIAVKGEALKDGINKTSYASISLPAESYIAYYEQKSNRKKSNSVKFNITNFAVVNELNKFAPIIERVTDTSIDIFSNEPSHDMAVIMMSDTISSKVELKRRRYSFTDLDPNTNYVVLTLNSKEVNLPSKEVNVKTLGEKDKLFEELRLYCYANSAQLIFPDMKIYNNLLDKAKKHSELNDKDATDSLLAIKNEYINLIKDLDKNTPGYDALIKEYDLNIKCCNEIIIFSMKLFNDFIDAVNIKAAIPMPTMFLDKQYDNIFTFDNKITNAEFYKNYGNIIQFHIGTPSYNFKNIDGVDNSFRFIGKPGMKHFVESLIDKGRSPRYEFYMMTSKEKEEFIKKDLEKDKLTNKDIEIIDNQITKDIQGLTETPDYKRAFMINAKKITNALFTPPEVETIDDNVLIKTDIFNLISDEYNIEYYMAISTYEDILCNNPIYKVKFTNKEEVIAITKLLHGLKADKEYAVWIEDIAFKQLSNVSTFVYNKDFNLDEDELKDYEVESIIKEVKNISRKTLPQNVYEDVLSILENNQSLTNYDIFSTVLYTAFQTSLNKSNIINFLKGMKYFLLTMQTSNSNVLSDIEFNNGILKFNSLKEGSLLMYNLQHDTCEQFTTKLTTNNLVNTTVYGNILLVVGLSENMNDKTDLIIVNNKEGYMEVL